MKKTFLISGLAVGLFMAQSALAQFYFGGGLGWTETSIDDNSFQVNGATASTLSKDDTDTGWKIYAGYAFTPNVAIEGGYADLGKFNATRTVIAPVAGSVSGNVKVTGWGLDVVGTLPVGNNFSLLGRAGAAYMTTELNASVTGALTVAPGTNLNPNSTDWVGKLGIGGQYDFAKQYAVRLEWERYFRVGSDESTGGTSDVNFISVSLQYKY